MAIQALVRPPGYHTHCYGFSYEADNELGNLEVMDTIYLNVSDTAGNMAAMQPFLYLSELRTILLLSLPLLLILR